MTSIGRAPGARVRALFGTAPIVRATPSFIRGRRGARDPPSTPFAPARCRPATIFNAASPRTPRRDRFDLPETPRAVSCRGRVRGPCRARQQAAARGRGGRPRLRETVVIEVGGRRGFPMRCPATRSDAVLIDGTARLRRRALSPAHCAWSMPTSFPITWSRSPAVAPFSRSESRNLSAHGIPLSVISGPAAASARSYGDGIGAPFDLIVWAC